MDDKKRYLIVGTGRSGSSLLAAILADAGANFSMPRRDSWNSGSGAYEHAKLWAAYRWYSRAQKIENSILPNALGWEFCLHQMRKNLRSVLDVARFAKYPHAIWLVHHIRKLGYEPLMIVSFRNFADYARSRYLRSGWSVPQMVTAYHEITSMALLQLKVFGGCTVSFEELTNPDETIWADALAQLTGLTSDDILAARAKRVNEPRKKPMDVSLLEGAVLDGTTQKIYMALNQLSGQVITPE